MWQQELTNYHDEAYYLFNDALNSYMAHLQKIYNRGMIDGWIKAEDIQNRSPWTLEQTLAYFDKLPFPTNETEIKIYMAGKSSTKSAEDAPDELLQPIIKEQSKFEFEPLLMEMAV